MELKLENLINKEKKNSCLILGPGETMMDFPFKKFNGKIIVIGDSAIRGQGLFKPDYWVVSNNHFPVPYISMHRKIINQFKKTTFFFAESTLHDFLWKKKIHILKKYLKVNWSFYDERHFNFKECKPKKQCCNYINNSYNFCTIQELVSKMYKHNVIASTGGTVFEYALAIALILGFSKIYIQGVDLPVYADKKFIKKNFDGVSYGINGHKYFSNFDQKISNQIKNNKIKTIDLIKKKREIMILKKNGTILKKLYTILKTFKQLIEFKKEQSFRNDILLILRNVQIYSDIAKKNKINIYNLSKNSNLNKIKSIIFKKKLLN